MKFSKYIFLLILILSLEFVTIDSRSQPTECSAACAGCVDICLADSTPDCSECAACNQNICGSAIPINSYMAFLLLSGISYGITAIKRFKGKSKGNE